jgi:hypothetical protein
VGLIACVENPLCFAGLVCPPDIRNIHRGDQHALRIAQGDGIAGRNFVRKGLADIEGNRHGPDHTAFQTHFIANVVVISFFQESFERRESAIQQKVQVAQLARR